MIRECAFRKDVVDFDDGWRKDRWESKLDKLKSSLFVHLAEESQAIVWAKIAPEIAKFNAHKHKTVPVEE